MGAAALERQGDRLLGPRTDEAAAQGSRHGLGSRGEVRAGRRLRAGILQAVSDGRERRGRRGSAVTRVPIRFRE
ncbi:hypothetical protein QR78_22935 [Methylobacterium indicum]|uniref:Uncharacterized protein n=1 Tax=Methylobacterium indicum TaxID=1775910 RepID=A0A0J6QZL6_9HYPH|nr:hypothetical protein QR78_22935 [Methylobacterium indicum]KMO23072.1 hypothetical protein QR79_14550 [Methylobacterium indicum]BCM85603.1 hypothetical protein mvi_40640 [Methylobacterium indicum]